ncbi:MAG: DUF2911 domain-containing protein, partial [Bacteroidota bacterium]
EREWTIIIHKNIDLRSIAGGQVKPENDAFRFTVQPQFHPVFIETFTIAFTNLRTSSCDLQLSWENTSVTIPIELEVTSKITAQIEQLLKEPEKLSHRNYFRAAEYYLHNAVDLDKAMDWINKALAKSENNFRYGLLKAKIFSAQGDKLKAIEMVTTANEWAKTASNANYIEQTSVYLASLEGENTPGSSNGPVVAYAEDVKSLDNILEALYEVISGEKHEKRDWQRFKHLFIPEARLIPTRKNEGGKMSYQIMSPDEYVIVAGKWLEENGFYEEEISRKIEKYGSLVHVFSTYESYRSKAEEEPFARGINSIQLLNDGERWWVVQIYWLGESDEWPLPTKYLPKD